MSNLSVYLYDDAGERAWKLTGEEMQVQVNGQTMYSSVILDKTLYASPYLVMDEHEYTKHYYIEGERVCSKIGSGFGPATVLPTSTPLNFIVGDESDCAENLKHLVYNHLECTDYNGDKKIYVDLQPAYNTNNDFEDKQYFYHPDHLGSSSFITNALGKAEQHMQYLPFGELWINQRNSEFDSPYKFSAKELDNESGYNYFGARYYDSEASIWLSVYTERGQARGGLACRSVDPLADARSWVSPYSYVQNSPVMRVDPTGALDDEWELDIETGDLKRTGDKGGQEVQHIQLVKGNKKRGSFEVESDTKFLEEYQEKLDDDYELVAVGSYIEASAAGGPGGAASSTRISFLDEDDADWIVKDIGAMVGVDAGAALGLVFVFGPKNLQGEDFDGYGLTLAGGAGCIEVGLQTSATRDGYPTWDYFIFNVGITLSIPGGGLIPSKTTVEKVEPLELQDPAYYRDRPSFHN